MEIKIVKRDGTEEYFSIDKLITSIAKTGVPLQRSEEIASDIKIWLEKTQQESGNISSNLVRDKVIEKLASEFPAEVDSYKAFKK